MVEVEWSFIAGKDLNAIIDYIAQDSLEYAVSFYEQVHEKIEYLTQFPNIGRIVPELDDPNMREIILSNYRLIYRIYREKIQIVRLFHGSRILDLEP